jgi:NAD+ synthase
VDLTPSLDAPAVRAQLTGFLQDYMQRTGRKGLVLGLSGGLDSAMVMALAAEALGPRKVLGLTLPMQDQNPTDGKHARLAAEQWGVRVEEVPIQGIVDALLGACKHEATPLARANARSRARMLVLYHHANSLDRLVAATGNKSELLVGYFTKHGDGAGDVHPLGDLYKTQVRILAKELGIPAPIVRKAPTAGLWKGQTDEGEMGVRYADLDRVLRGLEDQVSPEGIARSTGLPPAVVSKVVEMVRRSEHKRQGLVVPKVGFRTPGLDWRAPPSRGL